MNIFGEQDFYKYKVIKFIFVIFIIMLIISSMYLVNLTIQTMTLHNDSYKTIIQKNDFNQLSEIYVFRDFRFLPMISLEGVVSYGVGDTDFSSYSKLMNQIWKVEYNNGKKYSYPDYNELKKYIKVVLNLNVQENAQNYNHIVEFRQCTDDDIRVRIDKIQNIRIKSK